MLDSVKTFETVGAGKSDDSEEVVDDSTVDSVTDVSSSDVSFVFVVGIFFS